MSEIHPDEIHALMERAEHFADKAHMLEVELEAVEWECDYLKRKLAERDAAMREAEKLLREIQSAGVSFEDERVAYVEIQVHKETLRAIDAYLERGEQRG